MKVYGLDGCPTGWVVIGLGSGKPTFDVVGNLGWLLDSSASRVMIDMPIGLPEIGVRECDLLARQALRPHWSRVFTGAQRLMLAGDDQRTVNKKLKDLGQSGISVQLWCLRPKLRDVDAFVQQNRNLPVCECHPELVFQRLHGGPVPRKKSEIGRNLRRDLLAKDFPDLDQWLTRTRLKTGAKVDDVLDACACALAARDHAQGFCLPSSEPDRDPCGIPMQIWY